MHPYMRAPALTGYHKNNRNTCGTVAMVAPYGSTGEDCCLSVFVWLLTETGHFGAVMDLEFFVPDDIEAARRRLAGEPDPAAPG